MKSSPLLKITLLLAAATIITACGSNEQATPIAKTASVAAIATPLPATTTPIAEVLPANVLPEDYSWWHQGTFYEIFVRSFLDSDGDGIGDFNGIIEKLDYLNDGNPETTADLAVNSLWLMPVYPSPTYHGYGVTDYQSVNPDYGTLDDFKRLIAEAHQRGIKVILDLPLNHTSDQHPWFQQSLEPGSLYRDYYIWSETDPAYLGPWKQDPWHPGPKGGYYYGIFVPELPDLNLANPAVAAEIQKAAQFWLELGVDGFRLDGARYLIEEGEKQADTASTHQFYQDFRTFIKAIDPEALLLGEVWTDDFTASTYTKSGEELDLVFDFDLAAAMMASANNGRAEKALNGIRFNQKLFPGGKAAPFLTNHDMDRVISLLAGDQEKAKNAATMLLTAPGAPFVYYGEEIGMAGKRGAAKDDIQRRLPMQWTADENAGFTTGTPWTPVYPFYKATNVATESPDAGSLLAFYRGLIQLRGRHPALLFGDTYVINSDHPAIYAILRSGQGEGLLVLVNLSDQAVSDYTLELPAGPLKIPYALEPIFGEGQFAELTANPKGGFEAFQPLPELPANGRYILQLQPLE